MAAPTCIIHNMLFITLCAVSVLGVTIVRQSKNGLIQGNITTDGQDTYQTYLGIPYAEPPTGHRRFKAPYPKTNWTDTLEAFHYGHQCPQQVSFLGDIPSDEDCLFLNIFAPGQVNDSQSLAVMVFVHGGSYTMGNGNIYGKTLVLTGNVILVSLNYRLGILGFLSTGDDAARGNYGLLDQSLAFRWIHDNIAYFGGDPSRVTIFGESAGSSSVDFQAIAPSNKGLFQRVISESGTVLTPWAIQTKTMRNAVINYGASQLGCQDNDTTKLVDCFKKATVKQIITAQLPTMITTPVIDGDFISDSIADIFIFKNASINTMNFVKSLDRIIGCNNMEGGMLFLFFNYSLPNVTMSAGIPESDKMMYNMFLKPLLPKLTKDKPFKTALKQQYQYQSEDKVQRSKMWVNLYGDFMFLAATVSSSWVYTSLNNSGRTYMYYFTQDKAWPLLRSNAPSWFKGASHGEELQFVFGFAATPFTAEENILVTNMMTYWTNFAKTGNPNFPKKKKVPTATLR